MRLAWKKARQQHNYDFYLWINDDTYIHAAGDHDYGLRARKLGFKCYVSSFILAVCQHDESNIGLLIVSTLILKSIL
jgi:hypothetical protein